MDDSDHKGSHTSFHNDPHFLVATTLATLVVAGSTYIWRSAPRRLLADSNQRGESVHQVSNNATGIADHQYLGHETSKSEEVLSKDAAGDPAQAANDDLSNQADAKDPKSSRSKERRRRGKDPLKELLKGGKKSKVLTRSLKAAEADGDGVESPNSLPAIQESTSSHHAREQSFAPSSRSMSTASTSNRTTSPPNSDWAGSYPKQGTHESDDPNAITSSNVSNAFYLSSQKQTVPDSLTSDHSLHPDPLTISQSPESTNFCPSASSSTSNSSSIFSSETSITTSTSPTPSLFDKTPTQVPASPRGPANPVTPFIPPVQKDRGPWAWDTPPLSSISDSTSRKPPRFRSKSRGSLSSPVSPPTPASNMVAVSDSEPTLLLSSGQRDNGSHTFTFPTLNSSSGPVWNQSNRAANHATSNSNGASSTGNGHSNGTTSKRTPTPRRPTAPPNTPPPLASTPPPATQLASMKGALEAARLREEKTKSETERYLQEMEMMRRETVNWRRREMEVGSYP
jgi:anthranilate synthase/indole-3-glycerol phosphate synthase/phosphoribosylanthranilate isomerase